MPYLTREMARVGTLFRGAELIRSGVTTLNDMFCHSNASEFASLGVVDGLEELGLARRLYRLGLKTSHGARRRRFPFREIRRRARRACRTLRSLAARLLPRGNGDDPRANAMRCWRRRASWPGRWEREFTHIWPKCARKRLPRSCGGEKAPSSTPTRSGFSAPNAWPGTACGSRRPKWN